MLIGGIVIVSICTLLLVAALVNYGALWFQAYMSGADVSMLSLIGMSLRQVKPGMIVTAKIMGRQAGLNIDRQQGMSTARLEAHFLAGGDVTRVLRAIIAAHRAGIDLDFDRAAAIDLAGRDVLDAVRTSVLPKVIDCPEPQPGGRSTLSAVARNGVELRVHVRVTVRTNLLQLIGGATEETIIARVGQGIVSAIGSARTHMEVLEMPDRISKGVLNRGLDANTAFEIVSIDIADMEVGENIGARLQTDQAAADMRMAQARAEARCRRSDRLAAGDEGQGGRAPARRWCWPKPRYPQPWPCAFRAGQFHARRSPYRARDRSVKIRGRQVGSSERRPAPVVPPNSPTGAGNNIPFAVAGRRRRLPHGQVIFPHRPILGLLVDSLSQRLFCSLDLLLRGIVMLGNEVPDKAILQKVHQRVQQTGTGSQSKVTVNVRRGEVTVGGTIQYEMQRHNILRAAGRVAGVRRVVDQCSWNQRSGTGSARNTRRPWYLLCSPCRQGTCYTNFAAWSDD